MGHDVIIIGGGHNGLVAAFYLAKAGFKPLVLERRPVVGGAAITDEIFPGFKYSTLSHASGPLLPQIARDMDLARHGLETVHPDPCVFAPSLDGRHLVLRRDPRESAQHIAPFSERDARRYVEFHQTLERLGPVLLSLLTRTPPSLDTPTATDLWGLLKTARSFRNLGRSDVYRLLRWIPMAAADLASEWFESEPLSATVAARGIFGALLGPRSPGSGAILLLQSALGSGVNPITFVRGGLGSLSGALAGAARQAGAEIRTDAPVARIKISEGAAAGVVLATGDEIDGRFVISNADPRRTFLDLVEPGHLEPTFVARIQNYRCAGVVAKVNLALAALPHFTGLDTPAALSGRIHIGPNIEYLERAFDDAKYGELSHRPWLDAAIPSLTDPSLAPSGAHVMSIYVQFAPYSLKNGTWNNRRDSLGDVVVREMSAYAPDLPELILHRQVLTPLDLEDTYGLTGGHIYHGETALDQLFAMRPVYGWAQYRTPIRGLYLCGAGTHPGFGLTGASGASASREIIRDLR